MKWVIGLFLLFGLPSIGFAETLFTPPATDKSLEYLGMIFGSVGELPVSGGDATLSVLMRLINQIVLSLGFIIVGWTIVVSSLHSAQEGQVMGKKWSSIWVPTRAVLGMYLLLPSASGYSYIQIMVMWIILQSIGAADSLWNQVLTSWEQGGAINQPAPTIKFTSGTGTTSIMSMFKSKICETTLNSQSTEFELREQISFFQKDDKAIWGYPSDGTNVCGQIDMSPILAVIQSRSTNPLSEIQKAQALQNYFYSLDLVQLNLANSATEAAQRPANTWQNYLSLVNGVAELKSTISNALENAIQSNAPSEASRIDTTSARDAGWIHAGGFYFNIIKGDSKSGVSGITFSAPLSDMSALCVEKSNFCPDLQNKITTAFANYVTYIGQTAAVAESKGIKGFESNLNNLPPASQNSLSAISNSLKNIVNDFIKGISGDAEDKKVDPLLSLSSIGQKIMSASEAAIWACIIVLGTLALISSIMKSMQPAGYVVDTILIVAATVVMTLVVLLWGVGMTLGLYLPLIPYLLFLFGGLAWLIIVIETMVSSPLIALSLIVPSEDEIGKATAALVIIVGLFFRPSLMILGFVFASKLLIVAVGMLNYGFTNILNTTILGIGLFGAIAIVIIYAGILIAIVHEAFSLIYVLPDKALRWMGAHGEGTDIASNLKKIEGNVDTAAKTSGGLAKGATSAAMKLAKK